MKILIMVIMVIILMNIINDEMCIIINNVYINNINVILLILIWY